jgi:hypothetical protein
MALTRASAAVIKTEELVNNRNKIINGAMEIAQRGTEAVTGSADNKYPVDRFGTQKVGIASGGYTAQQSSIAPNGFVNSVAITVTSSSSVTGTDRATFFQFVEGLNCSDLNWGTANAKTVTLSFWVRSSLTGTFGGAVNNSDVNRTYPFTYSISATNTWEQKSVTIPGDTSGTWLTTNGVGVRIYFGIGVGPDRTGTAGSWAGADYRSATGATNIIGTNGATWYITGVQLEVGSVATPFERRPYGMELQLCQRYYYKITQSTSNAYFPSVGLCRTTTSSRNSIQFPVLMRTVPTSLETTGTASDYRLYFAGTASDCSVVPAISDTTTDGGIITVTVASGLTAGQASIIASGTSATNSYLAWSAEL